MSGRLPIERLAFSALVLLTLSPVLLQGLWRPLAQWTKVETDGVVLAGAPLAIAAVAVVGAALSAGRSSAAWLPVLSAAVTAVGLSLLLAFGPAVVAVLPALMGVALFSGLLLPWLLRHLPPELDGLAARRPGIAVLMVLLSLLTVYSTSRLSVYMGDPTRPELSLAPDNNFLTTHSCLTAYVEGSRLATLGDPNLYAAEHWPHISETPEGKAAEVAYAPFPMDAYAYPPPFLLLPRLLLGGLPDFFSQRALWFSFNGLFFAAALGIVARWVGGRAGIRALMLAPLVWMCPPAQFALQIGNVHAVVVAATMLALVAFEKRRPAVGGALLAFAVVSKISPGLILVVLLVQRQFRALLWTAAWGLFFVLAGIVIFGPDPIVDFVSYELPRLSSGEALPFLAWPESVNFNVSPFGIPFKLSAAGLFSGDLWATGRVFNQVYTLGLLLVTAVAGWKGGGRRAQAEMWAALAMLAALRSPYAPGYVVVAFPWLLSLRAADVRGWGAAIVMGLIWVATTTPLPLSGNTQQLVSISLQLLLIALCVYFLVRRPPVDEEMDTFPG